MNYYSRYDRRCYGTLKLTASSPTQSFCEPLSMEDVREFLRLPESSPANDAEEAMLEGFVIAARETAEGYQGRDLNQKQYDLRLDRFPSCEIDLRAPLQSVELVQYTDSDGNATMLVEGTDYIVDTSRSLIAPAYGTTWPCFTPYPSSAVLIRFTSGYAEDHPYWSNDGQRILAGMKMLIALWHENRVPLAASGVLEMPLAVTQLFSIGARPVVR